MTKSSDESAGTNRANYKKDLFFWVCNFHGSFGSEFAWYLFFRVSRQKFGPSPPVIQVVQNRL